MSSPGLDRGRLAGYLYPVERGGATIGQKIYFHRLGCPKLEVDSDLLEAGLRHGGLRFVESSEDADTVIVSTCAFIGDARAEAVEAMLEAANWKSEDEGKRRLYVTGCIPARYRETLAPDLPEVDGWYGPGQFGSLLERLGAEAVVGSEQLALAENDHPGRLRPALQELLSRLRHVDSTPSAYLKIAEGCDRRCAYCAIPEIRGSYSSRRPGAILSEASRLLAQGARELIVTAEEVNSYGRDLREKGVSIHTLLPRLGELVAGQDGWLRVLYTHPPLFTESFVQALADTPALVPYLDFPIEHADDGVLRIMGRGTTWEAMKRWIDLLREKINRLALRTSVIVGHPGEGAPEFTRLLKRLEEVRFERLGVFEYSEEEGTRAEKLGRKGAEMPLPDREEAAARGDEVRALALEQAEEWYEECVGQRAEMLVEGLDDDGRPTGRSQWDAPEIDGEALWMSSSAEVGEILRGVVVSGEPWELRIRAEQDDDGER